MQIACLKMATLLELVKRYEGEDGYRNLFEDFCEARLVNPEPPKCMSIRKHDKGEPKEMKPNYKNWRWMCPATKCRCVESFSRGNCFLKGIRTDPRTVLYAIYMWVQGEPPGRIAQEVSLDPKTVTQFNTWWREAIAVVNKEETEKLGVGGGIVEADETATGQRKYQRGKRQRKGGVLWWSTAVQTRQVESATGVKRKAEKMMARFAPDRTKETLAENLKETVSSFARLQTDCWKAIQVQVVFMF